MKTIQQWYDDYAVSHQNETNQKIHYICVPAIFFSIVGMIMSIPSGFLQNTVERCLILRKDTVIEAKDLNLSFSPVSDDIMIPEIPEEGISLVAVEKGLIKKALRKCNGNRSKAARLLKIERHVLIYRIEKFGL